LRAELRGIAVENELFEEGTLLLIKGSLDERLGCVLELQSPLVNEGLASACLSSFQPFDMLDDVGTPEEEVAKLGGWHPKHEHITHGFERDRRRLPRQQRLLADCVSELHVTEAFSVAVSDDDATMKWKVHAVRTLSGFEKLGARQSTAHLEHASDFLSGALVQRRENRIRAE
jgi:hypothetical protein